MKVVLVIPTYNEVGNIPLLVSKLWKVFEKVPRKWDMNILFVDDSSPDGTGDVIKKEMKSQKNIFLFVNKEKAGLGGAYMKGLSYAINKLKAEVLFEMDADMQHDEDLIPQFLEKIDEGADLVIGSRYIKGGSIPKYWGIKRKVLSVGGNIFTRVLMLDNGVHDWTTGFRALKPWVFQKVKDKITELKTYSFQVSFLYYARKEGAKVAEVPLNFGDRYYGVSKLPGMEGTIKTLWFVIKVRFLDFLRSKFFKFGIVGFVGYLVNAFFLYTFTKNNFTETLSWFLSTEFAIASNFVLNNLWTFREEKIMGIGKLIYKFLQFNLTSAGGLIIQTTVGSLGVKVFGPQYRQILLPLIIVFLVLPYNYFMYNVFIWKRWNLSKVFR